MSEQNKSPLPLKTKSPSGRKENSELFDFFIAMKRVAEGKKISRKEWENPRIYGIMNKETLLLHKEGEDYSWVISAGDLAGTDWFIVE